jgi:hypothetical protein
MVMSFLQAPAAAAYILAAAHGCSAPQPQLDFDFNVKKTAYVYTVSAEGLLRLKLKSGPMGHAGKMSGLTENVFTRNLAIHGKETKRPDGWSCFAPTRVVAKMELKPTVYISSAYRAGSCRYRVTRAHELEHVKIATDTLEEYAPVILSRLRKAVAAAGVAGPTTPEQLKRRRQRIVKSINSAYESVTAEMERKVALRQARIDTEDEYRRIAGLCPGEGY